MSLSPQIAHATGLPIAGVAAAVALFDEGATLPFVARYRKERTGGLDEVQLRQVLEQRKVLVELDQRRTAIKEALSAAGQLSNELSRALDQATRKSHLEDLYAPFKQRRATRADAARKRGLQPLADQIRRQPRQGRPHEEARRYVRGEVASIDEALAGARDIIAEQLASEPNLRATARRIVGETGAMASKLKKGQQAGTFRDYVDFSEPTRSIPSHRYLALCRGEAEGVLSVSLRVDADLLIEATVRAARLVRGSPFAQQLGLASEEAVKRLLLPTAVRAVRAVLKTRSDDEAMRVFQRNLEALLLAPPLGPEPVVGIDPGIRTGCKLAAVSATGEPLGHETLFLVGRSNPQSDALLAFLRRYRPHAVAVGNGTGGRETEAMVRQVVRDNQLPVRVVSVSEAGASVYSASELAGAELPGMDLTIRGAVSIARRLQDPLAELVKVEPKAIGVGQYQHDVDQRQLVQRLTDVVESCVNRVGVDVNTASPALLGHVAGLGPKTAANIVAYRHEYGPFKRRKTLLKVPGLGAKTFEQCAGFLRIHGGPDPLDRSGVHPERYGLVAAMAKDLGLDVATAIGSDRLSRLVLRNYVGEDVGLETLTDILAELQKPGRDPRESFAAAEFREDVNSVADVQVGMSLSGVVTNVTNFGAFVDIGVHQDGLVHVSQLADRFVRDPHEVVAPGAIVTVRVLDVDTDRGRISLTMKSESDR
ncbi:MAG: Tex-like N-terminal domain-containing protein [Myxococcota bacterium]